MDRIIRGIIKYHHHTRQGMVEQFKRVRDRPEVSSGQPFFGENRNSRFGPSLLLCESVTMRGVATAGTAMWGKPRAHSNGQIFSQKSLCGSHIRTRISFKGNEIQNWVNGQLANIINPLVAKHKAILPIISLIIFILKSAGFPFLRKIQPYK